MHFYMDLMNTSTILDVASTARASKMLAINHTSLRDFTTL